MSTGSIDRLVHVAPTPTAVARLWRSHGWDAVAERWPWMPGRELHRALRTGRVLTGEPVARGCRSRVPVDVGLAGLAAAIALGSTSAAEVAAGLRPNAIRVVSEGRGVQPPAAPPGVRGRNTREGVLANRGDADARARIEARLAHDRAVFAVCLAALSLVPSQPPLGPPRLPEPSPELTAALADHPPAAVAAVFPALEISRC